MPRCRCAPVDGDVPCLSEQAAVSARRDRAAGLAAVLRGPYRDGPVAAGRGRSEPGQCEPVPGARAVVPRGPRADLAGALPGADGPAGAGRAGATTPGAPAPPGPSAGAR